MPIYEYRCESCGFQKEHLQKMNDQPLAVCPSCQKETYKKQISASSFQLKGDGWYKGSAAEPASSPAPAGAGGCCGGGCACHGGS